MALKSVCLSVCLYIHLPNFQNICLYVWLFHCIFLFIWFIWCICFLVWMSGFLSLSFLMCQLLGSRCPSSVFGSKSRQKNRIRTSDNQSVKLNKQSPLMIEIVEESQFIWAIFIPLLSLWSLHNVRKVRFWGNFWFVRSN